MNLIVFWMTVCAIWVVCLWMVKKCDTSHWLLSRRELVQWSSISMVNALLIEKIMESTEDGIKLSILAGCLLFACMTDVRMYEVYQFVWWIGGVLGILCLPGNGGTIGELLIYCLLQELFFCRFYGRADCHAFVVCALMQFGRGMGLREYLTHMLFAFCGLAVIQFGRKNINGKGNLKKPVSFLPYITVSFWVNCCCFCWQKMI